MNKAKGEIALEMGVNGIVHLHETGGYRVKFPAKETLQEAILVNTAGGLVGGDSLDISLKINAPTMISTTGAEKIYGGLKSHLTLKAEVTSDLYWLPFEAILYNNANFTRKTDVYLSTHAKIVFAEIMVFGRLASGETVNKAFFHDIRHFYRDNKLIYAENTVFSGDLHARLDEKAIGNGARTMATLITTEGSIEELRCFDQPEVAFTQKNGLIIARFLSSDPHKLRLAFAKILGMLVPHTLPRNW
jgi:urease accessory protein